MRTTSALAVGAVALALATAGCGGGHSSSGGGSTAAANAPKTNGPEVNPAGDIPDNQAYVAYRPPRGGFSVKVPEGWSRIASGAAVTFTDKLNAISMQTRSASSPLTVASARQTEVPRLAGSVKGFKAGTVTTVSRPAGSAVKITYQATGRPDPVTGKVRRDAVEEYVFHHGAKDLVLTLSGPTGADNVDPWRLVSSSVRWTP